MILYNNKSYIEAIILNYSNDTDAKGNVQLALHYINYHWIILWYRRIGDMNMDCIKLLVKDNPNFPWKLSLWQLSGLRRH